MGQAFFDLVLVPSAPVLILEQHQITAADINPGCPASIVQQHQCEQSSGLRLIGHEFDDQPAKSNRLGAKLGPDAALHRMMLRSPR